MSMRISRFLVGALMGGLASAQLIAFVADDNKWPTGSTITYQVRLGGTSSGSLLDGTSSWTTVAQNSMTEWNTHIQDVQFAAVEAAVGGEGESNRVNDLFFSSTIYGDAFGGQTLAVTLNIFEGFSQPLPRVEADIVFNNKSDLNWNSYRGARRNDIDDLQRVLIHELGHALGLDHPDENSQSVSAVMNSLASNVDTVTTDDIEGAQSLYGVRSGSGGGGGGGGGSTGDSFEADDSATSASAIANGATQTHSIHEVGDKDWITFTVPDNTTNLTIQTAGSSGDTEIFLFGPNQSTAFVTSNDDIDLNGGNRFSRIVRAAPIGGTYFVRIEEFSNNATIASYTVNVTWTESSGGGGSIKVDAFESDDSPSSARTISNGETQNRNFHVVGDIDWATFTVGASGASSFVIETAGENPGDTELTLFGPNSSTVQIAYNDDIDTTGRNWFSRVTGSSLAAGTYFIKINELNNNDTLSAYTLKASWTENANAKLSNLSVRANTGGAFGTLILGFATSGANKEVLIRGMGPSIGDFGVQNTIPDPRLDMIRNGAAIDEVDDWGDETNSALITTRGAQLGAFAPTSLLEAILLRTVTPNPYTVLVRDVQNNTGQVLIEAYDADALSATGRLTNLSTRTEVGGAAGILTAGFVIAGSGELTLLIRGVGPTLSDFGVAGALSDPTLVVISSNSGNRVGNNDDWGSDNADAKRTTATAVGAFPLGEGSRDAALLINLPPGPYTVEMNSGSGGAQGNGLIEIYEVR